jgi:GDP-mannose 6-dehydrogenase
LRIYDENIRFEGLSGANLNFANARMPHLSKLLVEDIDDIYEHAEVIVVGNADPRFGDVLARRRPDQAVVDLVHIDKSARSNGSYEGLCW